MTCPLCGRADRIRDWGNARHCRRCSHFFSAARPAGDAAAFNDSVWHAGPEDAAWHYGGPDGPNRLGAEAIARLLGGRHGDLLDAGCGTGAFLRIAAAAGWRCSGLEPSPRAVSLARRHVPADIVAGRLGGRDGDPFPPASFDAVRLHHVLEHQEAPLEALFQVRRMLRPGGVAVIGVPDAGSSANLLRNAARGAAGRLRGRFACDVEPRMGHLHGFTRRSLRLALARAGFREILIRPVRRGDGTWHAFPHRLYRSLPPWHRVLHVIDALAMAWGGAPSALQAFAMRREA